MKKFIKTLILVLIVSLTFTFVGCGEPTLSSISMNDDVITEAVKDGKVELAELKLIAKYSDDTTKEVPVTADMVNADELAKLCNPGEYKITFTYEGQNVEVTFNVPEKPVKSLELKAESVEAFLANEVKDVTLLVLNVTYVDDSKEEVKVAEAMVDDMNKLTAVGKQEIVISYKDQSCKVEFNNRGKIVTAVVNESSLTEALKKDSFNYADILLDVTYENNDSVKLPLEESFFDANEFLKLKTTGKQTVNYKVGDVTGSFELRVPTPKGKMVNIEFVKDSIAAAYNKEVFNFTDILVKFTYESGEYCYSKLVARMFNEVDFINFYIKGDHVISFNYGGVKTTDTITVPEDKTYTLSEINSLEDNTQVVVVAYVSYALGTVLYIYDDEVSTYAEADNHQKLLNDLLVNGNKILFSCTKKTVDGEARLTKIGSIVSGNDKVTNTPKDVENYSDLEKYLYSYVTLKNAKVSVKPGSILNDDTNVMFDVTNGTDTATVCLPKAEEDNYTQKVFITLSELANGHELILENLLVTKVDGKLVLAITKESTVDYIRVEHEYQRPEEGELNVEFDKFMDELFLEFLGTSPFNINYQIFDVKAFDEKYGTDLENAEVIPSSPEDMTPEAELEYFEELKALQDKLLAFDRNTLSASQKLTYDVVEDYFKRSMNYLELNEDGENIYFYYGTQLGSYLGYQAQLPSIIAEYRFDDKKDIENYLLYIKTVQYDFEALYSFELAKCTAKDAVPLSDYVIDLVIGQCDAFIDTNEENYLITVFNERIGNYDFLTAEEVEEYKNKNAEYVNNYFVPAYKWLKAKLIELKAANNQNNQNDTLTGALSNTETGKKYYEVKFQDACGSDMTIPELIIYIEEKLKEYEKLAAIYPAYDGNLMEDAGLIKYKDENNEEIDYYQSLYSIIPFLQENVKEDFPELPYQLVQFENYDIKEIAESMQDNSSPAFYLVSPMDANTSEVIYINPRDFGAVDTNMFTTMAHEGYPGHLYQNVYYKNFDAPDIRSTISYTGYAEGWANYVENYVAKYVLDNYGMQQMMLLSTISALNNCRMDIGVNYEGWGVEEIIAQYGLTMDDVLSGRYQWSDGDIVSLDDFEEVYYFYVEVPTNYLMYFFSCAQIMDIKAEFKEEMGVYYSDKLFHTILLETGDASWPIIKKAFDEYSAKWGTNGTERQ